MKTFTFELDEKDVQTIFNGLGEIPLKTSGMVFSKMQEQLQNQRRDDAQDPE